MERGGHPGRRGLGPRHTPSWAACHGPWTSPHGGAQMRGCVGGGKLILQQGCGLPPGCPGLTLSNLKGPLRLPASTGPGAEHSLEQSHRPSVREPGAPPISARDDPSNKAHQLHPSSCSRQGAGGLEPRSREQDLGHGECGLHRVWAMVRFSRHILLSHPHLKGRFKKKLKKIKGRFPYTSSLGTNGGRVLSLPSPHSPAIQRASPGTAKAESVLRGRC